MFKENELKILAGFFPYAHRIYSTKDIEKRSRYSHERAHTTLSKLEKSGFVLRQKLGNVNIYRLNLEKKELFLAFLYYMSSSKRDLNLCDIEEQFADAEVSIYLPKEAVIDGKSVNLIALGLAGQNSQEKVLQLKEEEFFSRLTSSRSFYETVAAGIVFQGYEKFYDLVCRKGSRHHV